MNVLFWSEGFAPAIGGAEIWGARFVDALAARGHRVLVVTGTDPDPAGEPGLRDETTTVHRFPFWASLARHDGAFVSRIRECIARLKRTFRPDIVHVSSLGPSAFYHLVTRRAWRAPTLVTLHGWARLRPASGTLFRRIVTEADWLVGVSHAVLRETSELAPGIRARSSVIHHGIDLETRTSPWCSKRTSPPAVPADPPVLVCLGRLIREKGFDVAIEALNHVRRRFAAACLVVAGDGPDASALRERVRELGLEAHVSFPGPVAPVDVPALLRRASLVLVPSRVEAFGLVALEAAAMGRPVVAARVGGLPEVVEAGATGVLVEPDQPAALAEAIIGLLSNPASRRAMGDAARRRARLVFPWTACVDGYLNHYASLQRRPEAC